MPIKAESASGFLANEHPIEGQQDHGSDNAANETGWLNLSTNRACAKNQAAQPAANEHAADAEQAGDDEAAGILAGHEEFGNDADQQADQEHPQPGHANLLTFHCTGGGTVARRIRLVHALPARDAIVVSCLGQCIPLC